MDRLQAMPTASNPDVVLWLGYITAYFHPRSFSGLKPFPAVQMIPIKQKVVPFYYPVFWAIIFLILYFKMQGVLHCLTHSLEDAPQKS